MPGETIAWGRVFDALSLAYCWTPQEIADMTLTQITFYLSDAEGSQQTACLPPDEAKTLAEEIKARRDSWVNYRLEQLR